MPALAEKKQEIREPDIVDRVEEYLLSMSDATGFPCVAFPLVHRFTPGLYIREIHIPAGHILTSREHLLEHPFTISKGRISVRSETEGLVTYEAPHTGITKPGTRRVLIAHTDTIWTTYHLNPDDETDPDKIVGKITCHDNPLTNKDDKRLRGWSNEFAPNQTLIETTL